MACAAQWQLEKNGSQLYIKSYELGVLLLPSLLPRTDVGVSSSSGGSGAAAAGSSAAAGGGNGGAGGGGATPRPCLWAPRAGDANAAPPPPGSVTVPLPYSLPPKPYAPHDITWSTTDGRHLPRSQAAVPPDRHGRYPGEPSSGHYGPSSISKQLAERTRAKAQASGARKS